MKHTYAIKIEKNKIIDDLIIPVPDGEYQIQVSKPKRGRTNRQRRYLWGVVYKLIEQHTGHVQKELHEIFKQKFLTEVVTIMGKEYVVVKSTADDSDTDTAEMHEYIERVRAYAATEWGIAIPDPC